jgi:hypothetical protein
MNKIHKSLKPALKQIKKGDLLFFNKEFLIDLYEKPAIYLLTREDVNGSKVVYVGQTISLGQRIFDHMNSNITHEGKYKKDFDGVCFIFCDKKILNELEEILITVFNPEHNKTSANWLNKKVAEYLRTNVNHVIDSYDNFNDNAPKISIDNVIAILEKGIGLYMLEKLKDEAINE